MKNNKKTFKKHQEKALNEEKHREQVKALSSAMRDALNQIGALHETCDLENIDTEKISNDLLAGEEWITSYLRNQNVALRKYLALNEKLSLLHKTKPSPACIRSFLIKELKIW